MSHGRFEVLQWLFWQVGGLGPGAGQAHHFRAFASEQVPYGIKRFTDEVNRLYGVLDRRLQDREYIAGEYSIADMATWPWIVPHKRQGQDLAEFPNIARWFKARGQPPCRARRLRARARGLRRPGSAKISLRPNGAHAQRGARRVEMTQLILWGYDASPFTQRALRVLGMKKAEWKFVETPMMPPKDDLVALTGGYRGTPVLQIGADVYIDSQRIALELETPLPGADAVPVPAIPASRS